MCHKILHWSMAPQQYVHYLMYCHKWKIQLYTSSPVTRYVIVKNSCSFLKPFSAIWRFGWEQKLSQDHLYPALTLQLIADMRRELYILSPEDEFLSTHCCCRMVLTSSSSSSAMMMTSLIFIIPWERVSWLFFRLSLCLFLGTLAFYSCFPTLPLSVFGHS